MKLEQRIKDLEDSHANKNSTLSGMAETAGVFAMPVASRLLDVLMAKIDSRYPNAIPAILGQLGADITPSPEHQAQIQANQVNAQKANQIDTKSAFQMNE